MSGSDRPEAASFAVQEPACIVAPGLLDRVPANPPPKLLGPWCLDRDALAAGDREFVPAYGDREPPAPELFDAVYDEVVRLAAVALDRFHGTAIGHEYWAVYAGQFLSALVPVVADLRGRLELVCGQGTRPLIHGTRPALVPTSNRDALSDLYFDDGVIGQLASGLAGLCPTGVELHERSVTAPEVRRSAPSLRSRQARAMGVWTNRLVGWVQGGRSFGSWVLGVGELDRLRSGRRLREPILPVPKVATDLPDTAKLAWDPVSRERLATAFGNAAQDAGSDLARATLAVAHLAVPWQFAEGWERTKDFESLKGIARRRLIVTMFPSKRSLSLLATAKAQGAKLAFYQHGGVYGEGPIGWPERYERRVGDGFLSWGWRDGDDVTPAPSLRLERFAARYRAAVAHQPPGVPPVKFYTNHTSDEPHGYGLGSTKRVEQFTYVEDVLEPMLQVCDNAVVRRHPKAYRLGTQKGAPPENVTFEDLKVSSAESIASSSLVVLDLFRTTTFLECVTVAHPVVVFLARAPAPRDEQHAELIAALRLARIVNIGRDEMESFWRDCYSDLPGWWSGDRVQAAIAAYRERYAWVSVPWIGSFTAIVQDWFDRSTDDDAAPRVRGH